MISTQDLSAAELAALLHFHADAGVDWLLEEAPVDRFAEFTEMNAARQRARPAAPTVAGTPDVAVPMPAQASPDPRRATPAIARERPASGAAVAIPDDQAIAQARAAAASAGTLPALKEALDAFNGCNLKNSARSTLFISGTLASHVLIVGPMPNADDDRDGAPFSGRNGQLLDRMLASVGLSRDTVMLTNVLPWRPPGNRMPSAPEIEICRPFIERQIALAAPKTILVLGNFTARFFFGGNETIHMMRGQWRDITIEGKNVPALASLHPQELLTAPINKRLAWADLLNLKAQVNALTSA